MQRSHFGTDAHGYALPGVSMGAEDGRDRPTTSPPACAWPHAASTSGYAGYASPMTNYTQHAYSGQQQWYSPYVQQEQQYGASHAQQQLHFGHVSTMAASPFGHVPQSTPMNPRMSYMRGRGSGDTDMHSAVGSSVAA